MTDTVILCHVCGKPSRSGATHTACLPSPNAWGVVNASSDVEPNPCAAVTIVGRWTHVKRVALAPDLAEVIQRAAKGGPIVKEEQEAKHG